MPSEISRMLFAEDLARGQLHPVLNQEHDQTIATDRVSHHHAWVQARNGGIVRAYAWSEGTIWNQGPPTQTEVKLGLKTFDYFEGAPGMTADLAETVATNVKRIPLLAARWGLDLAQIREHLRVEEYGIAGKALPHLR